MDLSKLTFEKFSEPLRKRGIVEIRALIYSYGIELPVMDDKEALLRAAYESICARATGSGPTPAAKNQASTSPPELTPAPPIAAGAGRRFRVRSAIGNRWRCAHLFTPAWQPIRESQFSAKEWKAIRADKALQVVEVTE